MKAKEQRKKIQRAIVHLRNSTESLEVALRELRTIAKTVQGLIDGLFPQQEECDAESEEANARTEEETGQPPFGLGHGRWSEDQPVR